MQVAMSQDSFKTFEARVRQAIDQPHSEILEIHTTTENQFLITTVDAVAELVYNPGSIMLSIQVVRTTSLAATIAPPQVLENHIMALLFNLPAVGAGGGLREEIAKDKEAIADLKKKISVAKEHHDHEKVRHLEAELRKAEEKLHKDEEKLHKDEDELRRDIDRDKRDEDEIAVDKEREEVLESEVGQPHRPTQQPAPGTPRPFPRRP